MWLFEGVHDRTFMQGQVRYFGLTGGVASGKTTVARMFRELGARIIDADLIGHELIHPGLPAHEEIVRHFGDPILDASGEIDRKRLGAIVFADPAKLAELNRILHPRIIEAVEMLAREFHVRDPGAVIVVDAALIYEVGASDRFAKIIVAWCRPEQQIERLMTNVGLSREKAEERIAAQMPVEEKRRRADYVIDCSGALDHAHRQVEALFPQLQQLVRAGSL